MQAVYVGLDGQEWLFDEENLELKDYFVIKAATGLTRQAFLNGILDEDPAALQALVWFLRRRTEPDLSVHAVNFKPAALTVRDAKPAAEEPPSPTSLPASEPSVPPPTEPATTGSSPETETSPPAATSTSTYSLAGADSAPLTSTA